MEHDHLSVRRTNQAISTMRPYFTSRNRLLTGDNSLAKKTYIARVQENKFTDYVIVGCSVVEKVSIAAPRTGFPRLLFRIKNPMILVWFTVSITADTRAFTSFC